MLRGTVFLAFPHPRQPDTWRALTLAVTSTLLALQTPPQQAVLQSGSCPTTPSRQSRMGLAPLRSVSCPEVGVANTIHQYTHSSFSHASHWMCREQALLISTLTAVLVVSADTQVKCQPHPPDSLASKLHTGSKTCTPVCPWLVKWVIAAS